MKSYEQKKEKKKKLGKGIFQEILIYKMKLIISYCKI